MMEDLTVAARLEPLDERVENTSGSARTMRTRAVRFVFIATSLLVLSTPVIAAGATRYVRTTGNDAGTCTSQATPCRTITYAISQMAGGDTLIVGNGTYTSNTSVNAISRLPNGNAGPDGTPGTADDVYTTIKAETDFGVLIDGRPWTVPYTRGIDLYANSYIKIQGFRIFALAPMQIIASHHIKIIRNGFGYAATTVNQSSAIVGPDADYVLLEENYAFGGARYQFEVYWSNHTVMRRNVARNDYWNGSLQSAGFTNYDSVNTVWDNNIAIDSDTSCCTVLSGLYAGFFSENKTDHADDTTEEFHGNIVLNYGSWYGSNYDNVASGSHVLSNNIFWDSVGGYVGAQGPGTAASLQLSNMTIGAMKAANYASGSAVYIGPNVPNTVKNSIFANNKYGVIDYVNGNYNAFSGNSVNYFASTHAPVPGANDIVNLNIAGNILKYLPRGPETGSALSAAGEGGARVGAQVLWKIGLDGTLWGQPGWNVLRSPENGYGRPEDRLWPWPNEDVIKSDMAAYSGPGLSGPRGFAAPGNGLYGGPRTLSSYIWEYLGYPCPANMCRRLATQSDEDGDGKADPAIYRPSTGVWWSLTSGPSSSQSVVGPWGQATDIPVSGDFDGDGRNDRAIYRPSTGEWWILKSSTNFTTSAVYAWGSLGDQPVPADYDGDGKIDPAVYRPSTGTWYILKSGSGYNFYSSYVWGYLGDKPVPGDFDGDGKADPTVYRPSNGGWYSLTSSSTYSALLFHTWGSAGDTPVAADYDGDGSVDPAVYRPSTGSWFILYSGGNFATASSYVWGVGSDVPVPADFDGDGKVDVAIYRPSTGGWWILWSSSHFTTYSTYIWGSASDVPLLKR